MADDHRRTADRRSMPGLKGKNVLVTGGSSGHRPGDRRALRRVRRERRDQLPAPARGGRTRPRSRCMPASHKVQQEGVQDVLVQGDVSNEDDVVRMVARGGRGARRASTCSSTTPASRSRARPHELSSADFDRVLAVNLRGSFLCAREAIRHFLAEEKPRLDRQRLERPPADPEARLPRLLGEQGRDAEPHAHARARVRGRAASASTASARARPSRRSTAPGSTTPSQARAGRGAHPDAARRRRRTRWPASPASSPATTPPTSPARRSSSTAA